MGIETFDISHFDKSTVDHFIIHTKHIHTHIAFIQSQHYVAFQYYYTSIVCMHKYIHTVHSTCKQTLLLCIQYNCRFYVVCTYVRNYVHVCVICVCMCKCACIRACECALCVCL